MQLRMQWTFPCWRSWRSFIRVMWAQKKSIKINRSWSWKYVLNTSSMGWPGMKNSATYTSGRGAPLNGQRFLINFEVCLLDSQELLATCATIAVHTSGDVAIVEVAMLKRIPAKTNIDTVYTYPNDLCRLSGRYLHAFEVIRKQC